ncbi:Hypothetical predicted protein [Olea europaea subsp. europaea]|uniref:Uncharacterized protein n=1 Tax=Olea europaea subsp. europaea TaxID=158383 RepID=A0A8S0SG88_OLEEU|nr:Hypothetical predicted protein [Olea europaea subsp. europaea]
MVDYEEELGEVEREIVEEWDEVLVEKRKRTERRAFLRASCTAKEVQTVYMLRIATRGKVQAGTIASMLRRGQRAEFVVLGSRRKRETSNVDSKPCALGVSHLGPKELVEET